MSRINQPWISEVINSEKSLLPSKRSNFYIGLLMADSWSPFLLPWIYYDCLLFKRRWSWRMATKDHPYMVVTCHPPLLASSFTVLDRALYYKSFQHRWIIDDGELVVVQGGHREMYVQTDGINLVRMDSPVFHPFQDRLDRIFRRAIDSNVFLFPWLFIKLFIILLYCSSSGQIWYFLILVKCFWPDTKIANFYFCNLYIMNIYYIICSFIAWYSLY